MYKTQIQLILITLERQFSRYAINSTTATPFPPLPQIAKHFEVCEAENWEPRPRRKATHSQISHFKALVQKDNAILTRIRLLRLLRLLRIRFPDHSRARGFLPLRPVDDDESSIGIDACLAVISVASCKRSSQ